MKNNPKKRRITRKMIESKQNLNKKPKEIKNKVMKKQNKQQKIKIKIVKWRKKLINQKNS